MLNIFGNTACAEHWGFNGCNLVGQTASHSKQQLIRNSIILEIHHREMNTLFLFTCWTSQSTVERKQTTARWSLTWKGGYGGVSLWQHTEGICQCLQLILQSIQASLNLQWVVQDLDAAGVGVISHWKGALDAGHVCPGPRYEEDRNKNLSMTYIIKVSSKERLSLTSSWMAALKLPLYEHCKPQIFYLAAWNFMEKQL